MEAARMIVDASDAPSTEQQPQHSNVVSLAERLRLRRPIHQPRQWDGDPGFVGGFHAEVNPAPRRRVTEEDYETAKRLAQQFVESPMEDLM